MENDFNLKLGIAKGEAAPGYCGGRMLEVIGPDRIGFNFNSPIPRGLYISTCHVITQQMDLIKDRDSFIKYSLIHPLGGHCCIYIHESIHSEDSLYDEFDTHTQDNTHYAENLYLHSVRASPMSLSNRTAGLSNFDVSMVTKKDPNSRKKCYIDMAQFHSYMFFAKSPAGETTTKNRIFTSQSALKFMYYLYKNSVPYENPGYSAPVYGTKGPTAIRKVPINEEVLNRLGIDMGPHPPKTHLYLSALPTFNNHTYSDNHKACAMVISDRPIIFKKEE